MDTEDNIVLALRNLGCLYTCALGLGGRGVLLERVVHQRLYPEKWQLGHFKEHLTSFS